MGGHATVQSNKVHNKIKDLLEWYNRIKVTSNDIVAFHAAFEYIHPFQDGNGRVGRLIALKECLHHNIVPFIIKDHKKTFYYRGLANWQQERGCLIDTCLDAQNTFKDLLDLLEIPYNDRERS